ncbi:MAG: putative DNA binding domain-containing protein [Candidatus Riflebacteria bacterium]|nr:putative DNA binding domain-containing protein [Candidatus Riflebacteria bacterium]
MQENQNIEFKESWRDEHLKWICGFANAGGGKLVIGRDDQGNVVGLKDTQKLLEDIPNKVRDILGVMVDVDFFQEGGKGYLEIKVNEYSNPISFKGEYFYRSGSTNQVLKGAALARFLLRKQGLHWDSIALPRMKVSELDQEAILFFKNQALLSKRLDRTITKESTLSLFEKLHLLDEKKLKRAAVLLFHSDPEKFVTGACIKIGYFENDADLRYQDEVHGPLLKQVDRTIEIIKAKYFKALISYKGLQRIETYPVPEVALREAILNAVVHKDYSSGAPIQISVYSDKLMIWNPGQLPLDWSLEKLLTKHSSQPFNPDVAAVFFRAGLIEAWGRGIAEMLNSCQEEGLLPPKVKFDSNGIWVNFFFSSALSLNVSENAPMYPTSKIQVKTTNKRKKLSPKSANETNDEATNKNSVFPTIENEPTTFERILEILKKIPEISAKKLSITLGISEDGVRYHLKRMKALEFIDHRGSKKAGYWKVLK